MTKIIFYKLPQLPDLMYMEMEKDCNVMSWFPAQFTGFIFGKKEAFTAHEYTTQTAFWMHCQRMNVPRATLTEIRLETKRFGGGQTWIPGSDFFCPS